LSALCPDFLHIFFFRFEAVLRAGDVRCSGLAEQARRQFPFATPAATGNASSSTLRLMRDFAHRIIVLHDYVVRDHLVEMLEGAIEQISTLGN
jgi:hypothetical protein